MTKIQITINISKKEIEHMKGCDSYMDACGEVINIMKKVIKKIEELK